MNIPITIRQIDSRVPTKIFIFVIQKFTLKFYFYFLKKLYKYCFKNVKKLIYFT